ncbi:hypothetical protein J6Z39_09805 [bacterium]|nr:hypothetical protein [bacterium]
MNRRIAALLLVVFAFSALFAEEDREIELQLRNQALLLLASAKHECGELSKKNKALADSMEGIRRQAVEHKNTSVNLFSDAVYLLGYLQERLRDVCADIVFASPESVDELIAAEKKDLIKKRRESANFAEFIDKIYGSGYSKLLYITTAVSNLKKMHNEWAESMSSESRDIKRMLVNIGEANKHLREQLIEFTKGYKLFYEAKEPVRK